MNALDASAFPTRRNWSWRPCATRTIYRTRRRRT